MVNMASLSQKLEETLKYCNSQSDIRVDVLCSSVEEDTPSPYAHVKISNHPAGAKTEAAAQPSTCPSQMRLLLVSQKQTSLSSHPQETGEDWMLVSAAMIHEYAVQDTLVIYIEKVDTTGRWAPGSIGLRQGLSPSVALIQGYLAYIQSLSIPTHVYVFALPRPQYLFANSTDYPGKRVISDTGLIRWWQRLLTPLVHEPGVTGFVLTPGDTLKFPSRWQRGLGRASGSELARDVLALFPDDPIHRALQSEAAEGLSISEFIELLPVTEECGSGKRTGVFNIYLPGASPCKLPEASGDPKVSERMMHSLLQEAMFDTRQHAEEWSKRILAPLEGSDDKESSTMRIRIPGGIFDAEAWTRIKKLRGGQQVNQEVNILQPKKRSMEGHVNELLSQKKSFLKKEDSGNEAQAKETCESMNEL